VWLPDTASKTAPTTTTWDEPGKAYGCRRGPFVCDAKKPVRQLS
jgi:hypothetical protein